MIPTFDFGKTKCFVVEQDSAIYLEEAHWKEYRPRPFEPGYMYMQNLDYEWFDGWQIGDFKTTEWLEVPAFMRRKFKTWQNERVN